jgi:uncharacterized protein (DUF1015 family)
MAQILPFQAIRAADEYVERFSVSAHDSDAKEEAFKKHKDNPFSYLKILSPQLFQSKETTVEECYELSRKKLEELLDKEALLKEEKPCLYIYRQVKRNHVFTSVVALASVEEYMASGIKKHELTRTEKESKMSRYFKNVRLNGSPVLLTFHSEPALDALIMEAVEKAPEYHIIVPEDHAEHILWRIDDEKTIGEIQSLFKQVPSLYIADGHHRCAATAALYPEVTHFMTALIPSSQISIHGFHRYVRDLNGMTPAAFLEKLKENFKVEKLETQEPAPLPCTVHFYLENSWYALQFPENLKNQPNPKFNLDVYLLDKHIFENILNIADTRTSDRIKYVNGEVKVENLITPVKKGDMETVFMLYPLSVEDVIRISEYGETMPPKSTWIEPKIRSGLLIHQF